MTLSLAKLRHNRRWTTLPATLVAPSKESKVKKISVCAVPTSEKPPNNDAPLAPRPPPRDKLQRSAQALYKAPPERLESVQATVLREELGPTLPCKQSSDTDAPMQQEPWTSGFAEASSEPSSGRLRARKQELWESPAYRYYVPPPLAANAVPSPVYHSNALPHPMANTFPAPNCSEEAWTDGSTLRRIVIEETGPPGESAHERQPNIYYGTVNLYAELHIGTIATVYYTPKCHVFCEFLGKNTRLESSRHVTSILLCNLCS
ncbi:hypothetical protein MTO96_012139 [Rhipicephalus appendiculatus]